MTFFLSSLLPPPHWFCIFFSYHRNSATTRASDGELLDLSHCVAVLCCVVCVDLVQPHTSREVCYCGHLCSVGIGGVVCVLQALVLAFVSVRFVEIRSYDALCQHFGSVSARSVKIGTASDTALNRQKGFL